MNLSTAIEEFDDTRLLRYLMRIKKQGNKNELIKMKYGTYNDTSLQRAISVNRSKKVIFQMIDIGGKQLVMKTNRIGVTALHSACCKKPNHSVDMIISKLIKVGRRELLMKSNFYGSTALHYACRQKRVSWDIIYKMLEVGGRELVMITDWCGDTALHNVCRNAFITVDIISKLLKIGGKTLVMTIADRNGHTALHYACKNVYITVDIVSKLLEIGGRELVMMTAPYRGGRGACTALYLALHKKNVSLDIISKILEVGGRELLLIENHHGYNALHHGLFDWRVYSNNHEKYFRAFTLLFKEYIFANIGGEYGIGGLFNVANSKVQDKIYERWERFSPALKAAIESLQGYPTKQPPLILHAAILAKAPLHVIRDIITKFEYSVLQTDSWNRYPLVVAIEESGLDVNEGLVQKLIEATAVAQQKVKTIIYVAAQYGLKWRRHRMKELAEAKVDEIYNGHDSSTGLRVFMVAAMGNYHDLSAIYGMMKMSPETKNILISSDERPNKRSKPK